MTDFWLGFLTCLAAIFAASGIVFLGYAAAEYSDRRIDAAVQRQRRRNGSGPLWEETPTGLSGGRRA